MNNPNWSFDYGGTITYVQYFFICSLATLKDYELIRIWDPMECETEESENVTLGLEAAGEINAEGTKDLM